MLVSMRRAWPAVVPAVVVTVAMRARFFFSPISTDEGGYLAIGRAWLRGAALYKDHVIDRPQGLLLLYGLWDRIGLGSVFGVRLLAAAACVVAAVACGSLAATFVGERARLTVACVVAVMASVPQYEGFIANAELLSCAFGATCLALAAGSTWDGRPAPWTTLVLAGFAGGIALSMKQSGFDAVFASVVVLLIDAVRTRRWRPTAWFLGSFACALGLIVVHAALTGYHRWWYAVVGYKLHERSAVSNAKWEMLGETLRIVVPVLAGAVVVAMVGGIVAARRREGRRASVVLLAWFLSSLVAVAVGGNFHRHYWVIVVFPLGTAAGMLASLSRSTRWRRTGTLAAVLVPLLFTARASTFSDRRIALEIHADKRVWENVEVAAWLRPRMEAGDRVYAMCASAGLYGEMHLEPPFGHLWYDAIVHMPGVQEKLVAMLGGDDAPRWVVMYQSGGVCDPTGDVTEVLRRNYAVSGTVAGTPVLERISSD